jgi:hypothetical protein
MKLNANQVEQTLTQMNANVVPETHPMMPELEDVFGAHTFFVNIDGLTILEPPARDGSSGTECRVVHVANWADADLTRLMPHEPTPTGQHVAL